MNIGELVNLSYYVNEAIDSKKTLSIKDAMDAIEKGNIIELLSNDILSFKSINQQDKSFLVSGWQSILHVSNPSRKHLVNNSGFCLILAYLLQLICDGYDDIVNKK